MEKVQGSLLNFLQSHVPDLKADDIDEIVLSYVVSILDDLGQENNIEEAFDVESFCEMLFAYLPQASVIPPEAVTEWMFKLATEKNKNETDKKLDFDLKSVLLETTMKPSKPEKRSVRSPRTSESSSEGERRSRIARISETSDGGSEYSVEGEEFTTTVNHLLDMFPYACHLEVAHCLTLMVGNVEKAAHLIMHRHEAGQSLQPSDRKVIRNPRKSNYDEKSIKDRIVGKYGYVDQEDDARYHRPIIKKDDDKKLIRYRDGKIVSTKGERFTQVTKQESEEMKKTIKL